MKQTKSLIFGALSCLLLGVGFARVAAIQVGESPRTSAPVPGGDGPPPAIAFSDDFSRTSAPVPGGDGPPPSVTAFA